MTELSSRSRRVRTIAAALALGLLFAGTAWGQDDHFPFGPFRMFSHANKLNGRVNAARIEATTAAGDVISLSINPASFGLRRAEVEGQIPRIRAQPELLAHLAEAYENLHPGATITALRLYQQVYRLSDGRPSGYSEETLAVWTRA